MLGRASVRRRPRDHTDDEQLFTVIYPEVRAFAAAVAPPEVDPDDLVQEALTRVLRRGQLGDLDNPTAYLRTTVLNLARNQRRAWARRARALARLNPDDGAVDAYPSDLADLLRLPPETRAVLYLIEVEGRSFADVADILGLTQEAARARASRARHRLRELLAADLDPVMEA